MVHNLCLDPVGARFDLICGRQDPVLNPRITLGTAGPRPEPPLESKAGMSLRGLADLFLPQKPGCQCPAMYSAYLLISRLKSPHFDGKLRRSEIGVFDVYIDRKCPATHVSGIRNALFASRQPGPQTGPRFDPGRIPHIFFCSFFLPRPVFYALSTCAIRNLFRLLDRVVSALRPHPHTHTAPDHGPSWAPESPILT